MVCPGGAIVGKIYGPVPLSGLTTLDPCWVALSPSKSEVNSFVERSKTTTRCLTVETITTDCTVDSRADAPTDMRRLTCSRPSIKDTGSLSMQ